MINKNKIISIGILLLINFLVNANLAYDGSWFIDTDYIQGNLTGAGDIYGHVTGIIQASPIAGTICSATLGNNYQTQDYSMLVDLTFTTCGANNIMASQNYWYLNIYVPENTQENYSFSMNGQYHSPLLVAVNAGQPNLIANLTCYNLTTCHIGFSSGNPSGVKEFFCGNSANIHFDDIAYLELMMSNSTYKPDDTKNLFKISMPPFYSITRPDMSMSKNGVKENPLTGYGNNLGLERNASANVVTLMESGTSFNSYVCSTTTTTTTSTTTTTLAGQPKNCYIQINTLLDADNSPIQDALVTIKSYDSGIYTDQGYSSPEGVVTFSIPLLDIQNGQSIDFSVTKSNLTFKDLLYPPFKINHNDLRNGLNGGSCNGDGVIIRDTYAIPIENQSLPKDTARYCIDFRDSGTWNDLKNKGLIYTIRGLNTGLFLHDTYTNSICFNDTVLHNVNVNGNIYPNQQYQISTNGLNGYGNYNTQTDLYDTTERLTNWFSIYPDVISQNQSSTYCINGYLLDKRKTLIGNNYLSVNGCNFVENYTYNGGYTLCGLYGRNLCHIFVRGSSYYDEKNIYDNLYYVSGTQYNITLNDVGTSPSTTIPPEYTSTTQPTGTTIPTNIFYPTKIDVYTLLDTNAYGYVNVTVTDSNGNYLDKFITDSNGYHLYIGQLNKNMRFTANINGSIIYQDFIRVDSEDETPVKLNANSNGINYNMPSGISGWISTILNKLWWILIMFLLFIFAVPMMFGALLFLLFGLAISETIDKLRMTGIGIVFLFIFGMIILIIISLILPMLLT